MEQENIFNIVTSDEIINKIKSGDTLFIINGLCKHRNYELYLDYIFFKHFASLLTYDIIIQVVTNNIDNILLKYNTFNVYANLKYLTIVDIDAHKSFISTLSKYLKDMYPNKLDTCNIYNSPVFFSQVYNIISLFIDKDTQKKIKLIS